MTNNILIAIAGFLVFSVTGVAVASVVAHPDIPLGTQAATAVERITGLDMGTSDDSVEAEDTNNDDSGAVSDSERSDSENDDSEQGDESESDDDDGDDRGSSSVTTTTPPPAATPAGQTFTLAQVAMHNSATSCYTAIDGSVYDVTTWINQHPGGASAILSLCGVDGSAAFDGQHGGQRRPASELASFKIGALAH